MPRTLWDALTSAHELTAIAVTPRTWYFPNRNNGIATVPLAAEIAIKNSHAEMPPQVAATIIDERQGKMIATSSETLDWTTGQNSAGQNDAIRSAHWLRTVNLPPGSYELRVAALDPSTQAVGTGSWRFLIHSRDPDDGLAVSSLLLAGGCESATLQSSERKNLFDPLTWKDCRLVPAVPSVFRQNETLRALVRLYPAGVPSKEFPGKWTATISIWEPRQGKPLTFPVPIERSSGPGWAAFVEFPLSQLGLGPGDYQINVAFHGPKAKQAFSLQARFEIASQAY